MVTLKQHGSELRIGQFPTLLYIIGTLFTVPLLWSALTRLIEQTYDGGAGFFLVFSAMFWYVLLDYIALREEIIINRSSSIFYRRVKGLFRGTEQQILLAGVHKVLLETKADKYGTRYQYLYLQSHTDKYQINNHYLLRNEHHKVGKLVSDFLNIPFQEL